QRWQKADAALGRPVISNQVHFSLAFPKALKNLVPFAERENRIVIAYSPLEQGLLGGKYGVDNRPGGVRAITHCSAPRTCGASNRCCRRCVTSPRTLTPSRRRWHWPG